MDREGKHRIDGETTKEETESLEAIRSKSDRRNLLPDSPQLLGGSLNPKHPCQQSIGDCCNAAFHGSKDSLRATGR